MSDQQAVGLDRLGNGLIAAFCIAVMFILPYLVVDYGASWGYPRHITFPVAFAALFMPLPVGRFMQVVLFK